MERVFEVVIAPLASMFVECYGYICKEDPQSQRLVGRIKEGVLASLYLVAQCFPDPVFL